MTRYDKELRKHGVKLEADYPWLPYGNPALESVITRMTDEGFTGRGVLRCRLFYTDL